MDNPKTTAAAEYYEAIRAELRPFQGKWQPMYTYKDDYMYVLVTDGVEVWKSERLDEGWEKEDKWSGEPTAWMPLPEALK